MKALEIGLDWFPEHGGGLDRYFFDLMRHGPAAGLQVRGLVAGSPRTAEESDGQVEAFAIRTASLPTRLRAARAATRTAIGSFDPDLVASHFALHAFASLDLLRRPLAVHFQGPWADESGMQGASGLAIRAKRMIERAVYRRADHCLVLSSAFAELLHGRYGVAEERISVVPGSIDVARFACTPGTRAQCRAALGWPQDRPILLSVRRLVKRMGLEALVRAVGRVADRHGDVLLVIAGRGPDRTALQDRIDALGLTRHVQLAGFVPDADLPAAYRAADLTIVPTQTLEGFGLITAESLAAGTPVMVTPVGGLPEAVAPLTPDLVLPGCTADDIAAGLDAWLAGTLALPTAAQCLAYARANFDWSVAVPRIMKAYATAIATAR